MVVTSVQVTVEDAPRTTPVASDTEIETTGMILTTLMNTTPLGGDGVAIGVILRTIMTEIIMEALAVASLLLVEGRARVHGTAVVGIVRDRGHVRMILTVKIGRSLVHHLANTRRRIRKRSTGGVLRGTEKAPLTKRSQLLTSSLEK